MTCSLLLALSVVSSKPQEQHRYKYAVQLGFILMPAQSDSVFPSGQASMYGCAHWVCNCRTCRTIVELNSCYTLF